MKRIFWGLVAAAVLGLAVIFLAPHVASASLTDSLDAARKSVDNASTADLENLNRSVYSEAFLTARLIGFDPEEMEQLRDDVRELKKENAQLRAAMSGSRGAAVSVDADTASLEARVSKLESMFAGLQDSLVSLINMVSAVL
jgi:hypothetical protein